MLSQEDNELLTRVGSGTPMGELLRQYWLPLGLSSELPENDGKPLRLRLLSEDLIAFRDTTGAVGLVAENCPHRGAPLFFGRNEDCGLRCVYHGWKFDVTGRCVDMPNEPEESNFKDKVRVRAYPTRERNGVIWAYLGPRETPPELPDLEWNMVPETHSHKWLALRQCNWVQGLEGDIDTSHLYFLHGRLNEEDAPALGVWHQDKHPRLEIVSTDGGVMYGARREENEAEYYWRITQFLLPIYAYFPPGGFVGVPGHIWVPIDDEHTMAWTVICSPDRPLSEEERQRMDPANSVEYLPATSDALGRWRPKENKSNDYLHDFELQRTKTFTGIRSIFLQDQVVTEGMGPIYDRTQEHLGSSDAMVIQVRKRLMDAARALRDQGVTPPGVDDSAVYRVRSGSLLLPREREWVAGSADYLRAFSGLPVAAV